jgi:hypothetical protein
LMKLVHGQLATQYRKHLTGGQTWTSPNCPHCEEELPETFDHILRCNHPVAIKFRADFPKRLTSHLETTQLPKKFQQIVVLAVEQWLWNIDPLTVTTDHLTTMTDPLIVEVATYQHKIGWHLFFRGFISTKWDQYIDQTSRPNGTRHNRKTRTRLFSQLIQEMWSAQSEFWRTFQAARHQDPHDSLDLTSPSLHTKELQETVQHLYSLRPHVELCREDEYFPRDINFFMANTTPRTLQQYIQNYGQAIRQSIQRRNVQSNRSTKPIWSFKGFSRIPPTQHINHTTNTSPDPTRHTHQHRASIPAINNETNHTNTNTATGAPIPHKHSRWKITQQLRDHFRQYFQPK